MNRLIKLVSTLICEKETNFLNYITLVGNDFFLIKYKKRIILLIFN